MKLVIEFQAKCFRLLNLFDGGVQLARCLAKNQHTQSKLLYFVIAMNDLLSKRATPDFQVTYRVTVKFSYI